VQDFLGLVCVCKALCFLELSRFELAETFCFAALEQQLQDLLLHDKFDEGVGAKGSSEEFEDGYQVGSGIPLVAYSFGENDRDIRSTALGIVDKVFGPAMRADMGLCCDDPDLRANYYGVCLGCLIGEIRLKKRLVYAVSAKLSPSRTCLVNASTGYCFEQASQESIRSFADALADSTGPRQHCLFLELLNVNVDNCVQSHQTGSRSADATTNLKAQNRSLDHLGDFRGYGASYRVPQRLPLKCPCLSKCLIEDEKCFNAEVYVPKEALVMETSEEFEDSRIGRSGDVVVDGMLFSPKAATKPACMVSGQQLPRLRSNVRNYSPNGAALRAEHHSSSTTADVAVSMGGYRSMKHGRDSNDQASDLAESYASELGVYALSGAQRELEVFPENQSNSALAPTISSALTPTVSSAPKPSVSPRRVGASDLASGHSSRPRPDRLQGSRHRNETLETAKLAVLTDRDNISTVQTPFLPSTKPVSRGKLFYVVTPDNGRLPFSPCLRVGSCKPSCQGCRTSHCSSTPYNNVDAISYEDFVEDDYYPLPNLQANIYLDDMSDISDPGMSSWGARGGYSSCEANADKGSCCDLNTSDESGISTVVNLNCSSVFSHRSDVRSSDRTGQKDLLGGASFQSALCMASAVSLSKFAIRSKDAYVVDQFA
jgi:hypothetical protein